MRRVLILEDDFDFAELISEQLTKQDIKSLHCDRVSEALWKIKNEKFVLILVDFYLGTRDSTESIKSCRLKETLNNTTPVYLISGTIDASAIKPIGPFINKDYIKPFQIQDLVQDVIGVLQKKVA
jgi:two-component system OmpR family response regulator